MIFPADPSRIASKARLSAFALTIAAIGGCTAMAAGVQHKQKSHAVPKKPVAVAPAKDITTPLRLQYGYKLGDVRRYHVVGYFNGHFPPFASDGSEPIHLMILIDYAATVKKESDKGAEVEFNVEHADLAVLKNEPPEGVNIKVDDKDAMQFPIGLEQVRKMFNATATLKPTGEIAAIRGGDTSSMRLDIGIDLRKLFLLTAPIMLSDKPVKTGDQWTAADGLLGSKPGKTTYSDQLQALTGTGKSVLAVVTQQADSAVDSKLDKEGNSTSDSKAAVGTLAGNVTLKGTEQLTGATDAAAMPAATGRLSSAKLTMIANLKRTLPDPDKPGAQLVTDIDIKARLYVTPGVKPAAEIDPNKATTHASAGAKASGATSTVSAQK